MIVSTLCARTQLPQTSSVVELYDDAEDAWGAESMEEVPPILQLGLPCCMRFNKSPQMTNRHVYYVHACVWWLVRSDPGYVCRDRYKKHDFPESGRLE